MLNGFAVIAVVLAVGFLAARFSWLGPRGDEALGRLVFTIGFPALTFTVTTTSDLGVIFSATGLVALVSALAVIGLFLAVGLLLRWGAVRTLVGALTAGLVNSGNLGFPLSMYIFGSVAPVTSIMLFQQMLLTPVALIVLDLLTARGGDSRRRTLLRPFRNPIVLAALAGIAVNLGGVEVPAVLAQPIELLSRLTIPVMLLLFGMSLRDAGVRLDRADRAPVLVAVALKSVVHPLLAWVLAALVLRLDVGQVFVAVACACLPTAQNSLVYAMRYRTGVAAARATVIVTTVAAIPLLIAAIALFGGH